MNDESVKAVFTYTRDEYIRAIRRHYKTNIHLFRDLAIGSLTVLMGALTMYFSPPNLFFGGFIVILGLALFLILMYGFLILPALLYRSDPKLKWEYTLTFSDDKIEFKTNDIDSTLQWPLYHSWLRDDEFYILYHGKRNLSVIPRRALTSGDSDERLVELLKRKIGPPT